MDSIQSYLVATGPKTSSWLGIMVLNRMAPWGRLRRHPTNLLSLSKCPCRGATRNRDRDITAWATSSRQREMVHWTAPMRDWYRWISCGPHKGESSNSGWSFLSKGAWDLVGSSPNITL